MIMLKRFLSAPKRFLLGRIKKEKRVIVQAKLLYIDTEPIPEIQNKAIADLEYPEIYKDPYLLK